MLFETELNISLKQHSPLIHFEHYQKGASIILSELKPALDKFLFERNPEWTDFNNVKHLLVQYRNGKNETKLNAMFEEGYRALNYSVEANFIAKNPQRTVRIFGDKREISEYNSCSVLLKSRFPKLLEKIKESINLFFITWNFGTVKSKGFGCFTVDKVNGEQRELDITSYCKLLNNYRREWVIFKSNRYNLDQDLIVEIDRIWKLLKAGLNHGNKYSKSLLFCYFALKNKVSWEKRRIKQFAIEKNQFAQFYMIGNNMPIDKSFNNTDPDHTEIGFKFIRALLGLPGNYSFIQQKRDDAGDFINDDRGRKKRFFGEINVSVSHKTIERFASPVEFKIFENYIIIVAKNNLIADIEGEEFEFTFTKGIASPNNSFNLRVPDNFVLSDFLEWAFTLAKLKDKDVNWDKNFNNQNKDVKDLLNSVFNSNSDDIFEEFKQVVQMNNSPEKNLELIEELAGFTKIDLPIED